MLSSRPAVHHSMIAVGAVSAWSLDDLRMISSAEVSIDDPDASLDYDAVSIGATQSSRRRSPEDEIVMQIQVEQRELALAAERAEGHASGRIEGSAIEAARLRTAMMAAEEAVDAINAAGMDVSLVEQNVCALAMAVARQIIGRELSVDERLVHNLVQLSLREVPVDQPVRIRANPVDIRLLSEVGAGAHNASWIADETVSRGGCMVECRDRIVDGRVDSALERLYRRLVSLDE